MGALTCTDGDFRRGCEYLHQMQLALFNNR